MLTAGELHVKWMLREVLQGICAYRTNIINNLYFKEEGSRLQERKGL